MLLPFRWHEISSNFCRTLRVGCCVKNNRARVSYYRTLADRYAIHWNELYINNNVTFT